MPGVALVPVGAVDLPLLNYLSLMIGEALGIPTSIATRRLTPDFAYDPVRRQFESTRILSALIDGWGAGTHGKLLAVAECDLFIPILTFVFGEAQLDGQGAVLSIARLRQGFYGLPEDQARLYHRAEKEALHEIGHTFGLLHCRDYGCVMHFSNSVEDVDLKGDRYCAACASGFAAQGG